MIPDISRLPTEGAFYVQPCAFGGPVLGAPQAAVQVAGLPVWAHAVRLIVRDGPLRCYDQTFAVQMLLPALEQADGGTGRCAQISAALSRISEPRSSWEMGAGRVLRFDQTRVMGILNATPDSFSDGGDHLDPLAAVRAGLDMQASGADIIDIGGESTRPGATTVWEGDEIDRVVPVVSGLTGSGATLSVDTRKAAVMLPALEAGAHIINDVSALRFDARALEVAARSAAPVILMHAQGEPQSMQHSPRYDDVLLDVYDALERRIEKCVAAGIDRARIAVDPGIGFGKSLRHNLEILNGISLFHGLGCPVLLGVSRKRFIGALGGEDTPKHRLPGSLAAAQAAVLQGVHILRVHDVPETLQMLKVWRGLCDAAQMPPPAGI